MSGPTNTADGTGGADEPAAAGGNGPVLLYIVHEYPPIVGGAGVLAGTIANEFARDRRVAVITASETTRTRRDGAGNPDVLRLGIRFRDRRYHYATPLSMLMFAALAVWHGWRMGRRTRVRAIHAFHVFPSGLVGVILSRLLGAPCFVTAVGAEIYDPTRDSGYHSNPLYRGMIRAVLKRADRLSAISSDIAGRVLGFHRGRSVDVLPPPLPAAPPALEGRHEDGFRLCSVSRLARRKGLAVTIRALARLRELPMSYVVVGDGAERESLASLAESLGVVDRVDFRGFVDRATKYRVLADSDVFVLPSYHEGFGICYMEAMSMGLPVIAGPEGGHTDFIVDGENGILLPGIGERELSDALARLYHDPGLRRRMGAANRRRAEDYLPSNLRRRYMAHYSGAADP